MSTSAELKQRRNGQRGAAEDRSTRVLLVLVALAALLLIGGSMYARAARRWRARQRRAGSTLEYHEQVSRLLAVLEAHGSRHHVEHVLLQELTRPPPPAGSRGGTSASAAAGGMMSSASLRLVQEITGGDASGGSNSGGLAGAGPSSKAAVTVAAQGLMQLLSLLGVACSRDPSLPLTLAGDDAAGVPPPPVLLLAANLRKNQDLMPHLLLQLLRFAARYDRSRMMVSIYESGSTLHQPDCTPEWLALLARALTLLRVPHRIVTHGKHRGPSDERIPFLASMRNAALRPLYDDPDRGAGTYGGPPRRAPGQREYTYPPSHGDTYPSSHGDSGRSWASYGGGSSASSDAASGNAASTQRRLGTGPTDGSRRPNGTGSAEGIGTTAAAGAAAVAGATAAAASSGVPGSGGSGGGGDEGMPWPADRVVFFNDVYFCEGDLARMLSLSAGRLLGGKKTNTASSGVSASSGASASDRGGGGSTWSNGWAGGSASSGGSGGIDSGGMSNGSRGSGGGGDSGGAGAAAVAGNDLVCGVDVYKYNYVAYDRWVSRDRNGDMIDPQFPYVSHPYARARAMQGLPIPVSCCWNGMVIIDAAPLRGPRGLRIRPRLDTTGECHASECSLLCADLMRLGRNRFLMDPFTRVAYQRDSAQVLFEEARREFERGAASGTASTLGLAAVPFVAAAQALSPKAAVDWGPRGAAPPEQVLCCPEDKIDWKRGTDWCHMEPYPSAGPNYTDSFMRRLWDGDVRRRRRGRTREKRRRRLQRKLRRQQ